MLDKLAGIAAHCEEIERLLGDPVIAANYEKVAEYAQERSAILPIAEGYYEYKRVLEEIALSEAEIEQQLAEVSDG